MKSNQQIINEWSGGLTGITTEEAIPAMKEAQVEAIKELFTRCRRTKTSDTTGTEFLSKVENMAYLLIKEIES